MIDLTSEFGHAVELHLKNETVIWLTTVDSHLTPQPRPVWFLWTNDSILIFSQPNAYKVKHIEKHSRVALHFNTDDTGDKHVMILTGDAVIETNPPADSELSTYLDKYEKGITDLHMTPESFRDEYKTAIRITPTELRGWE